MHIRFRVMHSHAGAWERERFRVQGSGFKSDEDFSRSHAPAWECIPYGFPRWSMGTRQPTVNPEP